jgi:hypothetical protein
MASGPSWPRWTQPHKGDWVPEVDVVGSCEGSLLKFRLIWLKGDQLSIDFDQ